MAAVVNTPVFEIKDKTIHCSDESRIEILTAQILVVLLTVGGSPFLNVAVKIMITFPAFNGVDDTHPVQPAPDAEYRILKLADDGIRMNVSDGCSETDFFPGESDCTYRVQRQNFPFARHALRETEFRPVADCVYCDLQGLILREAEHRQESYSMTARQRQ